MVREHGRDRKLWLGSAGLCRHDSRCCKLDLVAVDRCKVPAAHSLGMA